MEVPPAVTTVAAEARKPFIAIVSNCKPGGDKKNYEKTVNEILKANEIHEAPVSMSNYSCSFTINLLKEERIRLSNSSSISSIDPDHKLSIP